MKTSKSLFFNSSKRYFSSFFCVVLMASVGVSPRVSAQDSIDPKTVVQVYAFGEYIPPSDGSRADGKPCEGKDVPLKAERSDGGPVEVTGSPTVYGKNKANYCCRASAPPEPFCPSPSSSAHLFDLLGEEPLYVKGAKEPVQIWGPEGHYNLITENRAIDPITVTFIGAVVVAGLIGLSAACAEPVPCPNCGGLDSNGWTWRRCGSESPGKCVACPPGGCK